MTSPLFDLVSVRDIESLLQTALDQGGDFAEVYIERSRTSSVALDEGKIRTAQGAQSLGLGVRVLSGTEVGYAYSDDLNIDVLRQTAKVAGSIARGSQGRGSASGSPRPALRVGAANSLNLYPMAPGDLPDNAALGDKVELLLRGDRQARAHDSRIRQVMGNFVDNTKDIVIANSDGVLAHDVQMMCRIHFSVIAQGHGQERRSGFYGGGGRVNLSHFNGFTPEQVAQEAARISLAQLGAKEAPAGPQTVVLAPGWSGILLHEAVGHGLEADFIHKGTSLYAGKVGQKVASPLCTVIDSGLLPHRRGSLNIDDEGCPAQEKVLIENGILKGFMVDALSARIMGTASTGSGRRQSYQHAPMPRMTNTYLAPGPHSHDEIVKSVDHGLYCASLGGGQVDISNGNFVFEVKEAYIIEKGKLTYPVQNATLIGIGPEALSNVSMVGNDAALDTGLGMCGKDGQTVPVGVGLPTVRIDNLTVGGTHVG